MIVKLHPKEILSEFTEVTSINNNVILNCNVKGNENGKLISNVTLSEIKKVNIDDSVTIITDSQYVKNGITEWIKNWKNNDWKTSSKKAVKNKDLWVVLDDLNSTYKISWKWIKAHQDDEKDDVKYNNLVDELARR